MCETVEEIIADEICEEDFGISEPVCKNVTDTVCETVEEEVCRGAEGCVTVEEEICETVDQENCQEVTREVENIEPVTECKIVQEEICTDNNSGQNGPNLATYGQKCEDITEEICTPVAKNVCSEPQAIESCATITDQIPETSCTTVDVQKCDIIQDQVCSPVYETRCNPVTSKSCR